MNPDSVITLLSWAVPACFACHIIEELFWPGGFREWYHGYRPQIAGAPMSYYCKANACYLAATLVIPFTRHPAYAALFGAGILFNNLVFTHVVGTFKTRQYSPGIVTGVLLYAPLFAGMTWYFLSHHVMGVPAALACALLSTSGEIYFALKKVPAVEEHLTGNPHPAKA